MRRIAVTGGPKTGKTTQTQGMEGLRSTDDLRGLGWSNASKRAAHWFDDPTVRVVEGVAVPRALRKWLKSHPTGKPVDEVVVLNEPFGELTTDQTRMTTSVRSVMLEIAPELRSRGVVVRGL